MHARTTVLLVAVMLTLTGSASAQETTGTISGRILDAQELPVPGVTVTVTGPQGSRVSVTDAEGWYTVPFLVPGTYTVRAELQGFKTAEVGNVNVSLGQTATANVVLEVGTLAETVQVTADRSDVNTRSTTTGAVLSSDMLANIPVGRRITDTLYIAPRRIERRFRRCREFLRRRRQRSRQSLCD